MTRGIEIPERAEGFRGESGCKAVPEILDGSWQVVDGDTLDQARSADIWSW